jgi:exonuclease SbcD
MKLSYDNERTRARQNPLEAEIMPETSPLELFGLLYEKQNNRDLSDEQKAYLTGMIESIWKEEA